MLPTSFQTIVDEYQSLSDPRERFQFLLELGDELPEIDESKKTPEHELRGCASKAWISVAFPNRKCALTGAAEAQISKGILAFFALGFLGCTPQEILKISDEELSQSGVLTSLSPSRSNGALSAWKVIQDSAKKLENV